MAVKKKAVKKKVTPKKARLKKVAVKKAKPKAPIDDKFKNRIVGTGSINPNKIKTNPLNFRKHPGLQKDAMEGILEEVGWVQNVIVNKTTGRLIDGHLRHDIAVQNKEPKIPVLYVELSEAEERLILATLDPIAELATKDRKLYEQLTSQIETDNHFLSMLLKRDAPKVSSDKVPPVPRTPVNQLGDIWILGKHRLMCGDSTDQQDVKQLMEGKKADMIFTDPPYNVAYEGSSGTIKNDDMSDQDFADFMQDVLANMYANTKQGGSIYVCYADAKSSTVPGVLKAVGWLHKQTVIWVKDSAVLSRQDYNWQHEPILYGWKPGKAHYFNQDFTQKTVVQDALNLKGKKAKDLIEIINGLLECIPTTIVEADKPARSPEHPTMKPVELVMRFIGNSSRRTDLVMDLFGGAGSTMIAAEKTGRRAYLMELEPKYTDVIITRWQNLTGEHAVHAETGETFEEISKAGPG